MNLDKNQALKMSVQKTAKETLLAVERIGTGERDQSPLTVYRKAPGTK